MVKKKKVMKLGLVMNLSNLSFNPDTQQADLLFVRGLLTSSRPGRVTW